MQDALVTVDCCNNDWLYCDNLIDYTVFHFAVKDSHPYTIDMDNVAVWFIECMLPSDYDESNNEYWKA